MNSQIQVKITYQPQDKKSDDHTHEERRNRRTVEEEPWVDKAQVWQNHAGCEFESRAMS